MRTSLIALAVAACAQRLAAQCPDGGAPPCTRPAARVERAPSIDRNRIAVLPFRVTTADTLLGEGFAELLAPEFTGEGGPRAIDMSTTLSAWRRAGGGLRSPLSQEAATRLAREIGAGLMAQGSIVGFGERLTVQAGLFDATSGRAIGQPARAAGPPDSVESLLRQIATSLLSAAGATTRVSEAARLTSSPSALRAYLEGLALWRRGRWDAAEAKFVESFSLDSTFASPAYQAYLLTSQSGRGAPWRTRTIALRARLPLRERTVVEEMVLPETTTSVAARIAQKRRVAERLGDAPEAWFLYGDEVYHNGQSVFGPDSAVKLAAAAFQRSEALDPVPALLYHLAEYSVIQRDTVIARRMLELYERAEGEERWPRSWALAAYLGDAPRLARLRQRGPDTSGSVNTSIAIAAIGDSPIPISLVEEGFRRLDAVTHGPALANLRLYHWMAQRMRGRPDASERALRGLETNIFRAGFIPWAWATGDPSLDGAALAAHGATPLTDSLAETRRLCAWASVRSARGHTDSVDLEALRPRVGRRCAELLALWKDLAARAVSDSTLSRVETLLDGGTYSTFIGYENRLAARMYESRGDIARALAAIHRYPRDYRGAWLAPTRREEGRLALMAGDTTRALRAYNHYLELRAEAEPSLVPERDSVRAIVSRLRRPR